MRRAFILPGLLFVLALPNWSIVGKERLLATGDVVFLELAPVDPRSLIQGDYMRLEYAISRAVEVQKDWPRDGAIVVTLDGRGVASYARRDDGRPLSAGEHLLRYRRRDHRVRVGSNAFFFEEGSASRYSGARYGELRVASDGNSVLVGLRDSLAAPIR
jgi:uncharacterized membrane-anchored protein